MNHRLRTFGAYVLLLAFVLGGVAAPHVHQLRHATEAVDVAHHTSACENASHDAHAPTATGHFHEVEIPECVLCATHHTFTAVVPDGRSHLQRFVRSADRSLQTHVPASPSLAIDIRGPPVWAA